MHAFANPARFMRLADQILPVATLLMAATVTAGLYGAFITSPPDYQQGESVRIMYIHVPAAWAAMSTYLAIAIASFTYLVWRHPLAALAARAAAPIGAMFTALALITGSLWGKPMWGTWWMWDGRMTSVLVLLFLYGGLIALWNALGDGDKGARATSILGLVGIINLPIIKFSVDWWSSLHQPASVLRLDGPTIHADMLTPLLVMGLAFQLYFLVVLLMRIKHLLNSRKIRAAEAVLQREQRP